MTKTITTPNGTANNIIYVPACPLCGEDTHLQVSTNEQETYENYLHNPTTLIQNVFPDWDQNTRELLISGSHADCWDEAFGEDE